MWCLEEKEKVGLLPRQCPPTQDWRPGEGGLPVSQPMESALTTCCPDEAAQAVCTVSPKLRYM